MPFLCCCAAVPANIIHLPLPSAGKRLIPFRGLSGPPRAGEAAAAAEVGAAGLGPGPGPPEPPSLPLPGGLPPAAGCPVSTAAPLPEGLPSPLAAPRFVCARPPLGGGGAARAGLLRGLLPPPAPLRWRVSGV